jgi:hypothetical protein
VYEQCDLEASLLEWCRLAAQLEATAMLPTTEHKMMLVAMRMRCELVKIRVNMAYETSELGYDNYLDEFNYVLELARQMVALKSAAPQGPIGEHKPSFIFESGFLPILLAVVFRCRRLDYRLQALSLMAQLSVAKENIFDVGTLYRVGRRSIEFEHEISLATEDLEHQARESDAPMPSEEKRITDHALDHEPDVRTDEHGVTRYRRRVWFMMKDPVTGQMNGLEQWISDFLPSHVSVPSIRCAKAVPMKEEFAQPVLVEG